jgi:hypothetical protein
MSEEYNGWSNRETWAFVLHCDNTIGKEFVCESLGYLTPDIVHAEECDDYQMGREVLSFVEDMWEEFRSEEWVALMRDDVGSVWRIDLREIGAWAREYAEESVRYAS